MGTLPFTPLFTTAKKANTAPAADSGIDNVVGVPFWAVRFGGIGSGESVATKNVDSVGDRFQMSRLHTEFVSTQVINCHCRWNGAHEVFIGQAVSQDSLARMNLETTVSSICAASSPYPATILWRFIYLLQKPHEGLFIHVQPLSTISDYSISQGAF